MSTISLQDIAHACGVHKSTVSKALQGHPRISEETRILIKQTAERRGYVPDAQLAKVATARWKHRKAGLGSRLGLIHYAHSQAGRGQNKSKRIQPGELTIIHDYAARLGYEVEVCESDETTNYDRIGRRLYTAGVEGILLHVVMEPRLISDFPWHHFSTV